VEKMAFLERKFPPQVAMPKALSQSDFSAH
jgi:hypothetical protein